MIKKNLKEALLPIFIVNWLLGVGMVEYPLGKPRPIISLFYVIVIIFGYFYIPVTKGYNICNFESAITTGTHLLHIIGTYTTCMALTSIILGWYYQKVLNLYIQRIELMNETLECLGAKDNLEKIHRLGSLGVLITLIGLTISFLAEYFRFRIIWTLKRSIYCAFLFHGPIIVTSVIDLTFELIVSSIGFTMKNVNILLKNSVHKNKKLENVQKNNEKHHRIITLIMANEFKPETPEKTKNLIQLLKQVHLELLKITLGINRIFGFQIAMITVANIVLLILFAYSLFNTDLYPIIARSIISCLIRFTRVALINEICENVANEALRTAEIIHDIGKENENIEMKEEIEQFSLQLSQRPIRFSICRLFTLKRATTKRILGTTATYLVSLIQVAPKEPLLLQNTTEILTTVSNYSENLEMN